MPRLLRLLKCARANAMLGNPMNLGSIVIVGMKFT